MNSLKVSSFCMLCGEDMPITDTTISLPDTNSLHDGDLGLGSRRKRSTSRKTCESCGMTAALSYSGLRRKSLSSPFPLTELDDSDDLKMFEHSSGISGSEGGTVNLRRTRSEAFDLGQEECYQNATLQIVSKREEQMTEDDIEVMSRLVHAKDAAAQVLNKQLLGLKKEKAWMEDRRRSITLALGKLQLTSDLRDVSTEESQRRWAERYNEAVNENLDLSRRLRKTQDQLRQADFQTAILRRKADELAAMLDSKDRLQFFQAKELDYKSEGKISEFELAVLGACRCRDSRQQPCACAKAACHKHFELKTFLEERDTVQRDCNDAWRLMEVYRSAFEEQLTENRELVRRLSAQNASNPNRRKIVLFADKSQKNHRGDPLLTMLCEKNEALHHQRILSRMLAHEVQELTKQLQERNG